MAENVGSIKYTTEVDTSSTLTAEKQLDKVTNKMVQDFNKVDQASKKMNTQMTKTSKSVNKGMAGMGRGAGQAGIQFQQFIGQVQGGQSVMLAFSQQSADLGIVLGAPLLGAIAGISASIAGILLPSLFKTTEGIIDLDDSIESLTKNFDKLSESQQNVARAAITAKIKEQRKAVQGLAREVNKIQSELVVAEKQEGFLENLLGGSPDKLRTELAKVKASLTAQNLAMKESKKQLKELGTDGDKLTDTINDISNGLTGQIIALAAGEEASFRYATAQQLGLKVGEQIPANIDAQISAIFQLKKAQEDAAKSEADAAKLKSERNKLTGQVQGLGLSPEEQIQARLTRELELLRMAQEQKIEIEGTYQDRRVELQRRADEQITTLHEKAAKDSIINFEALENQVIGTFAAIATGAQDGKAAIASLAQSILTQMVGALIKMGIQAVIGQTTAAATTSAAMGVIAVAAAPAAALVSLATAGANAAPAGAGIATVTGIAESVAIAGGRQFGGPVNANSAYRVGEAGPEIFTSGGKNFMIPGENGKVIANDDLGGGGFTQNVTIENNTPSKVTTSTSNDGKQMRIIINEIANQINTNQGVIPRSLRSSTNTKFKANS